MRNSAVWQGTSKLKSQQQTGIAVAYLDFLLPSISLADADREKTMVQFAGVMELPRTHNAEFLDEAEYPPAVIALCESNYRSIRRVRCYVRDGVARLEGLLPTFHQKQMAQEIVRRAKGVHRVDNRIVVDDWR
jgi:hypothetical protein